MKATISFDDNDGERLHRAINADEMAYFIADAFMSLNREIMEAEDSDIVKGMKAADMLLKDLLDEYPSVKGLQ